MLFSSKPCRFEFAVLKENGIERTAERVKMASLGTVEGQTRHLQCKNFSYVEGRRNEATLIGQTNVFLEIMKNTIVTQTLPLTRQDVVAATLRTMLQRTDGGRSKRQIVAENGIVVMTSKI